MKRSKIKPMSDKRIREMSERRKMMAAKFGPRELWVCQFEEFAKVADPVWNAPYFRPYPCMGSINGHELKKRSQGGSITDPENVVLLCNFHNDWVEDNPIDARAWGLVK